MWALKQSKYIKKLNSAQFNKKQVLLLHKYWPMAMSLWLDPDHWLDIAIVLEIEPNVPKKCTYAGSCDGPTYA